MKNSCRAIVAVFSLMLLHCLVLSLLTLHQETPAQYSRDRSYPRRMLVTSNSFSAHLNKLSEAAKDLQKSVEASLKKAPPSKSNPTQNR
ncbi:hypothetical protein BT93_B3077 [Corymbia citriodora subsp. variegata]|nr:hypothetical protein BT93_B3077 [Corymbia citriodora subsp. variegata]